MVRGIQMTTELKKIKSIKDHRGGGLILSMDYSTLEVRIFCAICGDPLLKEVLNSGKDLHCQTARAVFPELKGLSDKEIKEHHNGLRSRAKGVMFGLLYGKTTFNFAKEWGCTVDEAQAVLDGLMGAYPAIKTYVNEQHEFAKKNGYVVNMFGQRRPLPGAQLPEFGPTRKQFKHAMNAAQNTPIQSSASIMAWIAGAHVQEEFCLQNMQSVMIGGVHDSTYVDVYPKELIKCMKIFNFHAEVAANKIHNWMNGVHLPADFGLGQSWGRELDVKKWELHDGNMCRLTLKGGDVNWEYLKRELDEAYDYKVVSIEDGDAITEEEHENIPVRQSNKYVTVTLDFIDPDPNIEYKSKYYVGNGTFGKRVDTRENPIKSLL